MKFEVRRGSSLGGTILVLWAWMSLGGPKEWVAVGRVNDG